jgi:8-oxo-dGTP pyrophosphatase MutT (NUDIX family)
MSNKEHVIPVIIDKVIIETHFGKQEKFRQHYHNTLVLDLNDIKYIQNQRRSDNYTREIAVVRCYDENVTWPEHPLNVNGKIQGAIIIIKSLDSKILLVRNGRLWGLPKGARNYNDFNDLKKQTDDYYRDNDDILVHEEAHFTNDRIESAVENVCRETLEETGIIIDQNFLTPIQSHFQMNNYCAYDGFYYMYQKPSNGHLEDLKANSTDHENDELLWVDMEELALLLRNHRSHTHRKVFNHITYGFLEEYMRKQSSSMPGMCRPSYIIKT